MQTVASQGGKGGAIKKKAGPGFCPWWSTSSSTFANAQMVYIPSWQEFQEAAENLYEKSPNSVSPTLSPPPSSLADARTQTRYCVKWKSSEAKLVLKITDNTTVSPSLALFVREENDLTRICIL